MPTQPPILPSLPQQTYIVTGATSGIGYQIALQLSLTSAHIYICARSHQKGQDTISLIRTTHPSAKLSVLVLDHTRLSTVVSAAKEFLSKETSLHGLVNNAGIMATPFRVTDDGYEEQFQTNYLAHWLLTYHLLPIMQSTARKSATQGAVRIVNLTSSGHYSAPAGGIRFDDIALKGESGMTRYGQSKLANVLHAKSLHKAYGPNAPSSASASSNDSRGEIWVSAVHPGTVESGIGSKAELPWLVWAMLVPYRWLGGFIDAERGAWTSVFCAAGNEMKREDCGKYWQRMMDPNGWQSGAARDEGLEGKLEEWTRGEMERGGWLG